MYSGGEPWPAELDPRTVCLTVDVEWASPPVLGDLCRLLDSHGVRATFFVTHEGVSVPGHERGLHPNFRRNGDTWQRLREAHGSPDSLSEEKIYGFVVATTKTFAPEAKGVRSHALFSESSLMPLYRAAGLEYDCTFHMPLTPGLRPFWREHDMLGIATYYADHFDIITGATGFELNRLHLDRPGIKVLDLHPNIVYLNASANAQYLATKKFYHDPERLLAARHPGKGVRTLLLDLLAALAAKKIPTLLVGEVNALWRRTTPWS